MTANRDNQLVAELVDNGESLLDGVFSPDGRYVATAGVDQIVRIWDVGTRTAMSKLRGHTDTVKSISFSPAGDFLVSASYDGTARIWSVATGEVVLILDDHPAGVMSHANSTGHSLRTTC